MVRRSPILIGVKVLITGAAGFIGSKLAHQLQTKCDLVGIDDLSSGRMSNLESVNIDFIEGSILDERLVAKALHGCSAIVHLAARPSVPRSIADPVLSHEVNATGTLRVLEAARHLEDPLVIVASSSSVYGANPVLPKEETALPMPMSPYAVSKLATEQYAMAWQHSYGMRTLALRFFNVFGPHQVPGHAYAAVIPSFIWSALRGEPLTINGDGLQSRDFTYVGTVCDVLDDAITRGVSYQWPVNVAFGTRTTLLELINKLEIVLGHSMRVSHLSERPGDVRHSQAESSLLRTLFPSVVPAALEDGLIATVRWLENLV